MAPLVILRTLRDGDLPALLALAARAFTDVEASVDALLGSPLDRLATPSWAAHHDAAVRGVCEAEESTVTVAVEEGTTTIVGFVAHRVHPATAGMSAYGEIEIIAVDPTAREQGVGRALLDHAVADLRRSDAPVIMLQTGGDDGHAPARALYTAAGFKMLPVAQYWLPGAAR